jgi:hypothetical protein
MVNLNTINGIGKDQWFKYHFDGKTTRENPKSNITAVLTKGTRENIKFLDACVRVAQEIHELDTRRKLFVPMSGGCDSETVANSFYSQGIPFTPIIHDLWWNGLHCNYADTWWAHRWCRERNIKPMIKNTSVTEMIADLRPIINKVKGRKLFSAQQIIMSEMAKKHDGVVVNGQAFIEYYPEPTLDYLKTLIDDTSFYDENGQAKHGWLVHEDDFYIDLYDPGHHPYNFLSWNPEITLAYVKERDMTLNSEENKFNIMGCSPRAKLAAPEIVFVYIGEYQRKLKKMYGTSELSFLGTHEEVMNTLSQ